MTTPNPFPLSTPDEFVAAYHAACAFVRHGQPAEALLCLPGALTYLHEHADDLFVLRLVFLVDAIVAQVALPPAAATETRH